MLDNKRKILSEPEGAGVDEHTTALIEAARTTYRDIVVGKESRIKARFRSMGPF
jgi:hypothetical protein